MRLALIPPSLPSFLLSVTRLSGLELVLGIQRLDLVPAFLGLIVIWGDRHQTDNHTKITCNYYFDEVYEGESQAALGVYKGISPSLGSVERDFLN